MSKLYLANDSNQHQLIMGNMGAIAPGWSAANCEVKESLTPCLPPTSETTRQDGCNLQCVIFVYSGKMI